MGVGVGVEPPATVTSLLGREAVEAPPLTAVTTNETVRPAGSPMTCAVVASPGAEVLTPPPTGVTV